MTLIKFILYLCRKGKHDITRGRHCIRRGMFNKHSNPDEDKIYTSEQ